jgi:hypothetical protein
MYRIGQQYKIERKDGIFFTGKILEEDSINIRIETIRSEEIVLGKDEIKTAIVMKSTGDTDAQKR